MPSHVGQTRTELVQKTVRNILGDLTCYRPAGKFGLLILHTSLYCLLDAMGPVEELPLFHLGVDPVQHLGIDADRDSLARHMTVLTMNTIK